MALAGVEWSKCAKYSTDHARFCTILVVLAEYLRAGGYYDIRKSKFIDTYTVPPTLVLNNILKLQQDDKIRTYNFTFMYIMASTYGRSVQRNAH